MYYIPLSDWAGTHFHTSEGHETGPEFMKQHGFEYIIVINIWDNPRSGCNRTQDLVYAVEPLMHAPWTVATLHSGCMVYTIGCQNAEDAVYIKLRFHNGSLPEIIETAI